MIDAENPAGSRVQMNSIPSPTSGNLDIVFKIISAHCAIAALRICLGVQ